MAAFLVPFESAFLWQNVWEMLKDTKYATCRHVQLFLYATSTTNCFLLFFLLSNQPCPIATDFRAQQCSMFNNKAYRDRFYEWLPYYDETDQCSLYCKAKDFHFVIKLASSVKDGTRCSPGSLHMCVAGKCLVSNHFAKFYLSQ